MADDRLAALRVLQDEFTSLVVTSLERIAYDLAVAGWTIPQISHEIAVSRSLIPRMASRHATRAGLLSPFATTRDYEGAVDISRLVAAKARETVAAPPPTS